METMTHGFEQLPRERSLRTAANQPEPAGANENQRQSFEQLPRESVKAFAAFNLYLSLGPQRSTQAVAKKLAKSEQLIRRWCTKYGWLERAKAFEAHLAEVEREAIECLRREKGVEWFKVHEDQRIEEWKRRNIMLQFADEMIERWRKDPEKCGTLEGLARLVELALKLGRQASGMPMETKEIKGEIKATLEVEWEIALKKIYGGKAAGGNLKPEGRVIDVECQRPEAGGQMSEVKGQKAESGQFMLAENPMEKGT